MKRKLKKLRACFVRVLNQIAGLPDYDAYKNHVRDAHPDRAPMSYEEFFRDRQCARYGDKIGRCC